jgi:uncharacterized protein (DUF362 family)
MSAQDDAEREDRTAGAGRAAPGSAAAPPQPPILTRRRALIAAGVGVALAAGGGGTAAFLLRRAGRSTAPPGTITDHRVSLPAATPKLVIARGPSVTRNLDAALAKLGGLGQLVVRGDVVLVKPNIGWDRTPAQAANTDPELVAALVRACLQSGAAEVIVTDNPVNEAGRCFERSGIGPAAQQAGARVVLPGQAGALGVEIPGKLGRWSVLEPFARATKIINVPVAKHHGLTQFTGGMKNWIGAVSATRNRLHRGITESVAGLAALIRPTLTVVDLTRVLLRNGPAGGNLDDVKRLAAVAVSLDPVAVDAWAASELGFDLSKVEFLAVAQKLGVGSLDFKSVGPVEITV